MALSNPRVVFGIHSIVPYRRSDNTPYGILRVLGGGEIGLEAERVDLFGGSNRFPWVSEATIIDSEFTFTAKEYPDFVFELFLGASVATTAAEASGSVNDLSNVNGTSVVDATTGIASIAITTVADAKFGGYVLVATGANTVDLYGLANIDATRGTDLDLSDALLIESGITVPDTGGTIATTDTGLTITGGSGTIAFVTGDSATFDVYTPHSGVSKITVGAEGTTFDEFGARMIAARLSSNDLFELNVFRANGSGAPISLTENEFSEPELSMKLLYDSAKNAVFDIVALTA